MNLIFDASCLMGEDLTGVGNYARFLFPELQKKLSVNVVYKGSRIFKKNHIQKYIQVSAKPYFPFISDPFYPRNTIFHGPDFKMIATKHFKTVVTIHDLAIFQEDLLDSEFCHRGQQQMQKVMAQKPDAIIVDSDFVKKELLNRYPQTEGNVHSIPLGCDHIHAADSPQPLQSPYFLYVGTLEKRKNLELIIQAFNDFCKSNSDVEFIMVGKNGYGSTAIHQSLNQSPYKHRIHLKGFVESQNLYPLYAHALAFVYPSLYEGFGLPLLEAMRLGCPVITSNTGAVSEVAGSAAYKVSALSASELAEALSKFASDNSLRKKYILDGREHSSNFTWAKTCQETLKVYESI